MSIGTGAGHGALRPGMPIAEVIRVLGPPREAWGNVLDPNDMVLVFDKPEILSVLCFGGIAVQFIEARVGGPTAAPYMEALVVTISGDSIELKRRR